MELGIDDYVPETSDCVGLSETAAGDLTQGFKGFFTQGFTMNSYLQWTRSFQSLDPMLKTCYNVSNDGIHSALTYLRKFPSAGAYFQKLGWNFLYSFFPWWNVYDGFKAAIAADDNVKIAYWAGNATHLMFAVSPKLTAAPNDIVNPFYQFGLQFLNGTGMISSPQVSMCYSEYTSFMATCNRAKAAIDSDAPGHEQEAVQAIADAFNEFYPLNNQCNNGRMAMVSVFEQYMRIWTKPLEIFFNTINYFKPIFHLMTEAVNCAFTADMTCLGYKTGLLVNKVFWVQRT